MAIYIDKRPKFDKITSILLVLSILVFIAGMGGCKSDYAQDKNNKSTQAVVVTERYQVNGTRYIKYKIGEYDGEISVTEGTYNNAKVGKVMYFTLAKSDYEGQGWVPLFAIMMVAGAVLFVITFFPTMSTIINRYF